MVNKNRVQSIDILKILAMLMIFIVHCVSDSYSAYSGVLTYFQYGVEIFFVCNGYLTVKSLENSNVNHRFVQWYYRKWKRVFPVLLLAIAFSIVLEFWNLGLYFCNVRYFLLNNNVSLLTVVSTLTLTNFLVPKMGYFSLFTSTYAITNLLYYLVKKYFGFEGKKICIVYVIIVLELLLMPFIRPYFDSEHMYFYWYLAYTLRGMAAFSSGIIGYLFVRRLNRFSKLNFSFLLYLISAIIGFLYCLLRAYFYVGSFLTSLFTVIIICITYKIDLGIYVNKICNFFSPITFSFYLFHTMIYYMLKKILWNLIK
ncbi:acyltransferase family protein [Butyrivibrio sp. INlla14]|uniref:acyltransferase family protein n=1 Tax=Butyrivibrio sp. INlla14 TaxID=1520808 RepID=UPI003FA422AB